MKDTLISGRYKDVYYSKIAKENEDHSKLKEQIFAQYDRLIDENQKQKGCCFF